MTFRTKCENCESSPPIFPAITSPMAARPSSVSSDVDNDNYDCDYNNNDGNNDNDNNDDDNDDYTR